MSRDPRIDEKIAKAAPFAQPILAHLRKLVHATVPDAGETIKWGMPHFTYKGKNVAGMAAFKGHCAMTIHGEGRHGEFEGMGQIGKVTCMTDLPPDEEIAGKLREALARIDADGSAVKRPSKPKSEGELLIPQDFAAALRDSPAAQATFEVFSPSQRREYLDWVTEAKQDATRAKRLATSIEWLTEGKRRNWKYER